MQQRPSRSFGCPSFCFISCFVGVQKHQLMFSPKWDNLLLGVVGPSVPSRSGHEAAAMQQRPFRSVPSAASLPQRSSAAALPQRLSRRGPPTSALKQRPSPRGVSPVALLAGLAMAANATWRSCVQRRVPGTSYLGPKLSGTLFKKMPIVSRVF